MVFLIESVDNRFEGIECDECWAYGGVNLIISEPAFEVMKDLRLVENIHFGHIMIQNLLLLPGPNLLAQFPINNNPHSASYHRQPP